MSDGSNDDFDALSQEIKTLRAERDFALAKNHAPCLDSEALLRAEIRHLQANLQAECDEHDRVRAENAALSHAREVWCAEIDRLRALLTAPPDDAERAAMRAEYEWATSNGRDPIQDMADAFVAVRARKLGGDTDE